MYQLCPETICAVHISLLKKGCTSTKTKRNAHTQSHGHTTLNDVKWQVNMMPVGDIFTLINFNNGSHFCLK